MTLGTNFKFADTDTQHVNRESWDERNYSLNAWDDNRVMKDVYIPPYWLYKQQRKRNKWKVLMEMSVLFALCAIIAGFVYIFGGFYG